MSRLPAKTGHASPGRRRARTAVLVAACASALTLVASGTVLAASSATLVPRGVTSVRSSESSGNCAARVDVAFDVEVAFDEDARDVSYGAINPGSVAGAVLVDGQEVPAFPIPADDDERYDDYVLVLLEDTAQGTHTLWIKGGTDGIRWEGSESPSGEPIYGYMQTDYTTSFEITGCTPAEPTNPPASEPSAAPSGDAPNPTPPPESRPAGSAPRPSAPTSGVAAVASAEPTPAPDTEAAAGSVPGARSSPDADDRRVKLDDDRVKVVGGIQEVPLSEPLLDSDARGPDAPSTGVPWLLLIPLASVVGALGVSGFYVVRHWPRW